MGKKLFTFALCLFISVGAALAQTHKVSGTVRDAANDEPVVGAAVQLKGSTSSYTLTDVSGKYSLSVPDNGTLVISCLGFVAKEVPVNGMATVNVVLEPEHQQLQDVVVVAFGTTTKQAFTGSAKVVGSEDLAKSQVSTVTSALAGKVAGVQLTSSSGAPGSAPSIRIRGFSSISAGKEPLYIVDGMPYDGDLNNINPNDVESTTVLKDAASNSLYGARGANGVIIITTKRSKSSEAIITFDAKVGVNSRALKDYEYIKDPAMYYETHYQALKNYYLGLGYSDLAAHQQANSIIPRGASSGGLGYMVFNVPEGQSFIGTNGKVNPAATLGNTVAVNGVSYYLTPDDWTKEAYRNSVRQEYNLSIAGGGEKTNIYASLGYLKNEGITYNSDMTRITSRLKADYQAKPWLKVYGNLSYANFDYNSLSDNGTSNSTGNIWAFTSQLAPIYPLYLRDADGNRMHDANGFEMMDYGDGMNAGLLRPFMPNANPLFANRVDTRNSEGNAFSASGAADISFLRFFKLTINVTKSVDESRGTTVSNPYYGQFASSGGTVGKSHVRTTGFNTQQLLNYTQTFGLHNINVMVGHEYYDQNYYYLYGAKQKMFSQDNKELSGAVVDNKNAYSYTSEYNNEGFLSRIQYDYDNKIFASASFRRDASSRFDPDYRWGNFWSAGAAWIISKENWFKAKWVDMLKLKASIGSQGNDNIGSYLYTDTYEIKPSAGEVAAAFVQKGKKDITWETNTNINVGTEFTLFNGILDGSLEYFNRITSDMLFRFNVAPSLGYTFYYDNVGDMRNSGLEFSLNANIINQRDIQWSVNFNATKVKNKITYLHDDVKTLEVDGYKGYSDGSYFIGESLPLYTRYLKRYAGVDSQTGESLWYKNVKDEDGNITGTETTSVYSNADYYTCGNPIPSWYGGFGTSFYFHGFDFSINLSYQIGGKSYDSGYAASMASPTQGNTGTNFHKDVLKSWTKENPDSNIPRFQYADTYSAASSDRFLTNASYLNIENINVGYTFPTKWVGKVGLKSFRLYAAIENVNYWSKRKGFDPRYSFDGSTNATTYLPVRTVSGGITLKF